MIPKVKLLLVSAAALALATTLGGCAAVRAYQSSVSARSVGVQVGGKIIYRVEYR